MRRTSLVTGWLGRAPNLTNAQVEQKKLQRQLTNEAIATADRNASKAMQASGTAPKFMYCNDFRAVHVKKGDPWHSIHSSHRMKRCGYTAFCATCGSTSSDNHTSALHLLCSPAKVKTKYVLDPLDRSLRPLFDQRR